MHGDNPEASRERFAPTSGRVGGITALVLGFGFALVSLPAGDRGALALAALGLLVAGLGWSAMLRPRVAIEDDVLVLRNMVDTVRLPLAAVEDVVVRQVLSVRAGKKRYTSAAIGQTRRQVGRDDRLGGVADHGHGLEDGMRYALYVQQRIRERAEQDRTRRGIRVGSEEQAALAADVSRAFAIPEIVWLAGSALAAAVLLVA